MFSSARKKVRTAARLLTNPDEMRMFLKGRYPSVEDDSIIVYLWYPAFWRFLFYSARRYLTAREELGNKRLSNRYITRVPNSAGVGDQVSSCWVETYSIARKLGLQFVHHTLKRDPHSPGIDWETFLGFGVNEVQMSDLSLAEGPQHIKTVFVPPLRHDHQRKLRTFETIITKVYCEDNILFHLGSGVYLNNDSEREFSPYKLLRSKYDRAKLKHSLNDKLGTRNELRIAVHVRRGDVKDLKISNVKGYKKRWLGIEYYKRVIQTILAEIGEARFSIHVFSDGGPDDVRPLAADFACVSHLDESADLAFHQMVSADILVPGLSSFSLVAGKISRGVKIVGTQFDDVKPSLFIPQTSDWIRVEESGCAILQGREQLRRYIRERCSAFE